MRKTKTAALKAADSPSRSAPAPKDAKLVAVIDKPNFQQASFVIRGNAPFVQNRFSEKAQNMMIANQTSGSQGKKGKKREAKDFKALFVASMYRTKRGKRGINAACFRLAMIDACRTVNFKMTLAKLGLFTVADDYDEFDGTPLVLFRKGEPQMHLAPVRNQTGVADIRARGMWKPGWEMKVTLRWDADMFSATDIANLLHRVGWQVGIGEGRPNSKQSAGVGWGTFDVVGGAK